ncbi:uncharacterized protein LACBIDRAFT_309336 [Laccaria bicolor S238N-H82]|uniref:Predicted protein n=1 Tax=Laccaria bicolor (strain S238N-H82 / ATCC MYA-4686) TaxID=486041 RepID=B0E4N7_LACBS|nr:uncharacterized protein LACBIDRAFT_309336 [Laccaria bicolor S238N-H82]EDQ98195.1 predicted protein [Laccaria bicolor S238N-H82]|eukprot:XP_001891156.1 predicted protein [Laccaria bicolor S238N-H82]
MATKAQHSTGRWECAQQQQSVCYQAQASMTLELPLAHDKDNPYLAHHYNGRKGAGPEPAPSSYTHANSAYSPNQPQLHYASSSTS